MPHWHKEYTLCTHVVLVIICDVMFSLMTSFTYKSMSPPRHDPTTVVAVTKYTVRNNLPR
jgi:hypothetical protein